MPDDRSFALQRVDRARDDFALLADELDFLKDQIAAIPKRDELWRVAGMAVPHCAGSQGRCAV